MLYPGRVEPNAVKIVDSTASIILNQESLTGESKVDFHLGRNWSQRSLEAMNSNS